MEQELLLLTILVVAILELIKLTLIDSDLKEGVNLLRSKSA